MYGDDDTHITGQITSAQIAEAIRHKKYGRDMREAIAQGFEQFIGILGRVSNLESEYSDLQSEYSDLQSKYSDLLSKYNDIIGRLNDDENKINGLQGDVNALTKKHNDDIEAINQRLTKLEKAVFEAQYINDTDDIADHDKPVISQDINDTNVIDDDDGLIIEQDNYKSLPSDIS